MSWESEKAGFDSRAFIDALRECLGLGPLYREDEPSHYALEHHINIRDMAGHVCKSRVSDHR